MHNMCDKHKHMPALVNNAGAASGITSTTMRFEGLTSFYLTRSFNGTMSALTFFLRSQSKYSMFTIWVCEGYVFLVRGKYPHIFLGILLIRDFRKQCKQRCSGTKQRGDKKSSSTWIEHTLKIYWVSYESIKIENGIGSFGSQQKNNRFCAAHTTFSC